jgi:hypothetical protein
MRGKSPLLSRYGLYVAAGLLMFFALVSAAVGRLLGAAFRDVLVNLGAEFFGIAMMALVIDALLQFHETQRDKERLIREMGSPDNEIALRAVEELRARGWLEDGMLHGVYLGRANLQEATLSRANLQGADLYQANLQRAFLGGANLRGANLVLANLRGSYLRGINLQEVNLHLADLGGAWMSGANLQGATLQEVNLQEAGLLSDHQLSQAALMLGAKMPDGSLYNGRFNLAGDIKLAGFFGVNPNDPSAMAEFYKVSLEEYQRGQAGARERADWLKEVQGDAYMGKDDDDAEE